MREVLKRLLDDINNPDNEDRLFDLFNLYTLITNNKIYPSEIKEIRGEI